MVIHPWHTTRFVRQERLDGDPFIVGEFVAHDSRLLFGGLNHGLSAELNFRYGGGSAQHVVAVSISACDPKRTSRVWLGSQAPAFFSVIYFTYFRA
jgi:hypothetical protein